MANFRHMLGDLKKMILDFFKKHIDIIHMTIIVIFSFVFFYNFNAISPVNNEIVFENDLAIFYTAGLSMKRGLVLYRDLFDHKGPYIYFLFYLSSVLGEINHIGMYILFSFIFSILFIIIYKIIIICTGNKNISLLTSLSSILYMFNDFTSYANLSPENIIYLYIAICIYLFLKNREKFYNDEKVNDYRTIFFIGIFAGFILMSKYSLVSLLLPIIIIYLIDIVKNKNYKKLFYMFIYGMLGVIVGLMPAIIYIFKNNIINDFIEAYVLFNTKYLGDKFILVKRYVGYTASLLEMIDKFKIVLIMSFISIFIMHKFYTTNTYVKQNVNKKIKKDEEYKNEIKLFYILSVLLSIFNIMLTKRSYSYYTSILVVGFIPVCYFIIDKVLKLTKYKIAFSVWIVYLLYFISYSFIGNRIVNRKYEYKGIDDFKKYYIEAKNSIKKENISFLSISIPNYYLIFDEVPASKYFIRPMIERARFNDYYENIEEDVYNFKYDIFVLSYTGDFATYFSDEFYDFVRENYEVVSVLNQDKILVRKQ